MPQNGFLLLCQCTEFRPRCGSSQRASKPLAVRMEGKGRERGKGMVRERGRVEMGKDEGGFRGGAVGWEAVKWGGRPT